MKDNGAADVLAVAPDPNDSTSNATGMDSIVEEAPVLACRRTSSDPVLTRLQRRLLFGAIGTARALPRRLLPAPATPRRRA